MLDFLASGQMNRQAKEMLNVSASYLEKKIFLKKYNLGRSL